MGACEADLGAGVLWVLTCAGLRLLEEERAEKKKGSGGAVGGGRVVLGNGAEGKVKRLR